MRLLESYEGQGGAPIRKLSGARGEEIESNDQKCAILLGMSATSTSISIGKKPTLINLTDAAVAKVSDLISREDDADALVLRVAVKPGGCSGFSYDMFFDTEVADDDLTVLFDEVKVVVDPASAEHLKGATLDYVDGLNGAGFAFTNPNATRTCGCGSSFS